MTKQELWQSVYIEAMRQGRMNNPKELADKAVEEFEERFGKSKKITMEDVFDKDALEYIDNNKILNTGDNKVDFKPFTKTKGIKIKLEEPFTQAGRLKRLFEEMKFDIDCEDNEGLSTIKVKLTHKCIVFDFEDGVYQNSYVV